MCVVFLRGQPDMTIDQVAASRSCGPCRILAKKRCALFALGGVAELRWSHAHRPPSSEMARIWPPSPISMRLRDDSWINCRACNMRLVRARRHSGGLFEHAREMEWFSLANSASFSIEMLSAGARTYPRSCGPCVGKPPRQSGLCDATFVYFSAM